MVFWRKGQMCLKYCEWILKFFVLSISVGCPIISYVKIRLRVNMFLYSEAMETMTVLFHSCFDESAKCI